MLRRGILCGLEDRFMSRIPRAVLFVVLIALVGVASMFAQGATPAPSQSRPALRPPSGYYPARGAWETRKPSEVGMDEAQLAEAIELARTRDSAFAKTDYGADQLRTFGRPLGPVPPSRGGTNGIVIKNGYLVAEFGDTSVVEPTYSVAKSYLSTILGLTLDRGLIKNVTDPVRVYIKDGGYDSPQNAGITWVHHARQTSEWEGTMFGKPSTFLGTEEFGNGQMKPREIREPGTYYEYNDVRVNRFSASLMRLWKRPLGDVLKSEIMDPIGASSTWKWMGYDNADLDVDGKTIRSVPGGTRWGGGLWMTTRDHARFALLMARHGKWQGKQIVSESWIRQATTAGGVANSPDYGYLWWLNTKGGGRGLPTTSYQARGNGGNTLFIDPEHDLVVVLRWNTGGDFFARVVASIKP